MKTLFLSMLLTSSALATAQLPGTARWEASVQPITRQGVLVVNVTAQIEKGWHVYALSQAPGGPTPLRVAVEPGAPYQIAGSIEGTTPQKHHDPSFDLETQLYTDTFTLKVPIKATSGSAANVPLAIRFQMCSDTTCMPPKTVHLVGSATSTSASLTK